MLALIGLILLSNFPGPTQGSADKSAGPPEDVSKGEALTRPAPIARLVEGLSFLNLVWLIGRGQNGLK
jgi:hypothetical protein